MQIKVKSLQGDEFTIEIDASQQVLQLKASISEKADGVPIERQKLVYKGRTMQDSCLLTEYNLEEGCKVHLILQRGTPTCSQSEINRSTQQTDPLNTINSASNPDPTGHLRSQSNTLQSKSKFELILKERLAQHFCPMTLEKIMRNLHEEIERDVQSSSLDDLERLAKQKLNISGE